MIAPFLGRTPLLPLSLLPRGARRQGLGRLQWPPPGILGPRGVYPDMAEGKGLGRADPGAVPPVPTQPLPEAPSSPRNHFPSNQSLPLQCPVVTAKKRQAQALRVPGKRGACHPGPEQPGPLTSVGQTNIIK